MGGQSKKNIYLLRRRLTARCLVSYRTVNWGEDTNPPIATQSLVAKKFGDQKLVHINCLISNGEHPYPDVDKLVTLLLGMQVMSGVRTCQPPRRKSKTCICARSCWAL